MAQKHIRCAECRFARADETYGENLVNKILFGNDWINELCCPEMILEDDWVAYECGNRNSEYFRSLLNVSVDGDKLPNITWTGCEHGERKVSQ